MGGGDVGFRLGTEGQERGADLLKTGVALEEPARHLRLPRQTAEIHDGAGMGKDVCAHGGGIDHGDGTGGIWCQRRRAGIRGRIGFGGGPINIERWVVPGGTFGIVVGRGLRWRIVNIRRLIARGFILSLLTGTLRQHRRCVPEPTHIEPRSNADRFRDAVGKAEIQCTCRMILRPSAVAISRSSTSMARSISARLR
jgi:hypothetical protein